MTNVNVFELILYAAGKKGTGKTQLLKDGIDNYNRPFMYVCKTIKDGRRTCENPNAMFITSDTISKIHGNNLPIIIDSEFLLEFLPLAFEEIIVEMMKRDTL